MQQFVFQVSSHYISVRQLSISTRDEYGAKEASKMIPEIPSSDEELLSECEVETFRSSGPGGQNVNKRDTAVRLRHLPTGIVVTCQQERSQYRNKQIALAQLRERLESLSHPATPRIPTTEPRSVRKKILDFKRRRTEKKNLRKRPKIED